MTANNQNSLVQELDFGTFTWANIVSPTSEMLAKELEDYRFHHLDLEDCLSKTQLPKIDEYNDYLFIILHFPRYLKDKKYSVPVQVSIFLGDDFLVTVHNGELKPIANLFKKCEEELASGRVTVGNPAFLLYRLIYSIVDNMHLMIGKVLLNLEEIEQKVFDDRADAARDISQLRHDIANIRRIVFPLRRVIHELEKKTQEYQDEDMEVYFSNLSDSIDKLWTTLEECKETLEIYKDSDFIMSTDRTNKILTLLTILLTFPIPYMMISSIYGMNIILPGGADYDPPTFLGPYTTFYILMGISTLLVIGMIYYFKRKNWL